MLTYIINPKGRSHVRTTLAELRLPSTPLFSGEGYTDEDSERLAGVLAAIADPARLQILSLIDASPFNEVPVKDLTEQMKLSQPTVSHHLRILHQAGLLQRDKRSVWVYYSLTPNAIKAVLELLQPRKRGRRGPAPKAEAPTAGTETSAA